MSTQHFMKLPIRVRSEALFFGFTIPVDEPFERPGMREGRVRTGEATVCEGEAFVGGCKRPFEDIFEQRHAILRGYGANRLCVLSIGGREIRRESNIR